MRVELFAAVGHHLETALHGTDRRAQRTGTRIAETLTRAQVRLLADHAGTAHLLLMPGTVGNDPVPRDQLDRLRALVADRDVVREQVVARARVGAFGHVL